MKKFLLSSMAALGIAHATIFGGLSIVPQADYKVGGNTYKTNTLFGFNAGFMRTVFQSNFIIGGKLEGTFGKMKDNDDSTSSASILADAGYRINTEYPIDIYGIVGYRFSRIGDDAGYLNAHGAGFGAGIATYIGYFRPAIEYTHFNMSGDGVDFDDDRVTFDLDLISF